MAALALEQERTITLEPATKGQALIYCRVSTKGQEEDGTSLHTQEAGCVQHAEALGYTVAHIAREVYSGAELWDRPLLAQGRAELKAGKYQALIAYATDRLSRDPIHLAIIAEECERAGVELVFVTEPLDTSPEGGLIRYVKGYAAQIEREKIKERSLRGKLGRLQSGKVHSFGHEKYGYRRDKEKGLRLIYEPEAGVVRDIFRWYVEDGLSMYQILHRLNGAGVPSPSESKRPGHTRPAPWGSKTVYLMLRDRGYKGETVLRLTVRQTSGARGGKQVPLPAEARMVLPEGTTPPIVSPELWEKAQRRLDTNRGASTRNETHQALLRGMTYCAVCRQPMYVHVTRGVRYYRCTSYEYRRCVHGGKPAMAEDKLLKRPRSADGAHFAALDDVSRATLPRRSGLERRVWERVEAALRDPARIVEELERQRSEGPDPVLSGDLEHARRALARLAHQQQRLLAAYAEAGDDFPLEALRQQMAATEREKAQYERTIAELEARLAQQQAARDQMAAVVSYVERVRARLTTFSFEEKRLVLEALDVRVYANGWDEERIEAAIDLDANTVVSCNSW